MDTDERQYVREFAYTMRETFKDDPNGLKEAHSDARKAVKMLREAFPGESDDTLCCVARGVTAMAGQLHHLSVRGVANALESVVNAYPFAAGSLAGVYILPPEEKEDEGGGKPPPVPPTPIQNDKNTGLYL